jgi:molybdopterin/thiamine biosynthesis adenylyltransferase
MSFLGDEGLSKLSRTRIAVLGGGGGGSHIVQQLAHVGIGEITIIDHDVLERSNVNRVVGSTYADVGRAKATILSERFKGYGAVLRPIISRGEDPAGVAALQRADLVIAAVDGFRARDSFERICRQALVPYIDIGLRIATDDIGNTTAIGGQIMVSKVGGPCLRCAGVLTDALLAADRVEYAAAGPEQQVVSMNGILASQAVTAAIFLVSGFAPGYEVPAHLVYDGLAHEIRRNRFLPPSCAHHSISNAGWAAVLPPKVGIR